MLRDKHLSILGAVVSFGAGGALMLRRIDAPWLAYPGLVVFVALAACLGLFIGRKVEREVNKVMTPEELQAMLDHAESGGPAVFKLGLIVVPTCFAPVLLHTMLHLPWSVSLIPVGLGMAAVVGLMVREFRNRPPLNPTLQAWVDRQKAEKERKSKKLGGD